MMRGLVLATLVAVSAAGGDPPPAPLDEDDTPMPPGHGHGHGHKHPKPQIEIAACRGITGSAITEDGLCVMQGKTEDGGMDNGMICQGVRDVELSADMFDEPTRTFVCEDGTVVENGAYHMPKQVHWCRFFRWLALFAAFGLFGLFVACKVVAPRQGFSSDNKLHGCTQDMGSCFLTMFCPCATWGSNAAFVTSGNVAPSQFTPWLFCMTYWCCHNFACCLGLASRNGLRKKLHLEGNLAQDSCIHCFAHPCALCQEHREIVTAKQNGQPVLATLPAAATTFVVECPQGVTAGMPLSLQTPAGLVQIVVPDGIAAGQAFHVQVEAPPVPTLTATVVAPSSQKMHSVHTGKELEMNIL